MHGGCVRRHKNAGSPGSLGDACGPCERVQGVGRNMIRPILEITFPSREGHNRFVTSRSEEHTSELQSLMRISYAVFCLKKKKRTITYNHTQKQKQLLTK